MRLSEQRVDRAAGAAGQAAARALRPLHARTRPRCRCCAPTRRSCLARAAVPDARPRPRGRDRASTSRALIEWVLAPRGRPRPSGRRRRGRARGARSGPLPEFAALAERLDARVPAVRGAGRRVAPAGGQVRLRRAAGAPGPLVALLRHAGLHRGGELPRRGRRPGRDAGAHDARWSTTCTGAVLAPGPRDADRPAIHYVADAGAAGRAGSERALRHRARALPRPGRARRVGDRAGARAAVVARRPAGAGGVRRARRSRCCCRPRRSSRASCCAVGEHPLVRLVLAPYRLCLAAATVAAVVAGATLAFHALERDARRRLGPRRACGRPRCGYPDRRGRTRAGGRQRPLMNLSPHLPPRAALPQGHQGAVGRGALAPSSRCRRSARPITGERGARRAGALARPPRGGRHRFLELLALRQATLSP